MCELEQDFKSFRKDLMKMNYKRKEMVGGVYDYDDAMKIIQESLTEKLGTQMELNQNKSSNDEQVIKDKAYLRKKKEEYRSYISDIVYSKNIRVRGYENADFIDEMVEEFAGYSILADAFNDPDVSDIFVIDWKTIFVEKNMGKSSKNVRYPKTFRSPKHYHNVLERFLRCDEKQVNNGENKIVDFELYQDRGCVTSSAVSPRDYSLTIRKHKEDHIKKEQLVQWEVLTEKMADFIGMLIHGECNIIYAGITGSGKTTTIRALLDHYVTKANKRVLVCEDTRELFLQNEHTLSLVTFKHDDPKSAVSLEKLIITALRLKPKYIVVGEVRGAEAQAAVEGMETGHSTIFTMHGDTPWDIVNRLVNKYLMAMPSLGIDVVERIIGSAVDYICIQDDIPGTGRKLTSISEVSYDFDKRRVAIKTICYYDFFKRDFVWVNKISREKADKMLRKGIPIETIKEWVED